MAGKMCPRCKSWTFFKSIGEDRKCTSCGYEMHVPITRKGKGDKCPFCEKFTVQNQNGKLYCTNCGATFK